MSGDLVVLLVMTGVGAAWLATHLVLLGRTVFGRHSLWAWRVAALVPVLTPVAAWQLKARVFPILWLLFATAYLGLRYFAKAP